jgi:hypothetical protein
MRGAPGRTRAQQGNCLAPQTPRSGACCGPPPPPAAAAAARRRRESLALSARPQGPHPRLLGATRPAFHVCRPPDRRLAGPRKRARAALFRRPRRERQRGGLLLLLHPLASSLSIGGPSPGTPSIDVVGRIRADLSYPGGGRDERRGCGGQRAGERGRAVLLLWRQKKPDAVRRFGSRLGLRRSTPLREAKRREKRVPHLH